MPDMTEYEITSRLISEVQALEKIVAALLNAHPKLKHVLWLEHVNKDLGEK